MCHPNKKSSFLKKIINFAAKLKKMLPKSITTILLLICSNTFMSFAWYGHLKLSQIPKFSNLSLICAILISWGIAFIEYCFLIPANRIGFEGNGGPFSLLQLKVIQEVITLMVFSIFNILVFSGSTLQWNHICAYILLIAAAYLMFLK